MKKQDSASQAPQTTTPEINAPDVALVFEGGGPRATYTAPVVQALLDHNVKPGWVGGMSAGATHALNFISGDYDRCRKANLDLYSSPDRPGLGSFLRGRGFFNDKRLFGDMCYDGGLIEVNYQAILDNPTPYTLGALCLETGETEYWGREDQHSLDELLLQARASSSLPILMSKTEINGKHYIDGMFSETAGIPFDIAQRDGFEKLIVVMTRPRDYVRPPVKRPQFFARLYKKYPAAVEAINGRPGRFNAVKQELLDLEKQGKALLYFPDKTELENTDSDPAKMQKAFAEGQEQIAREWPRFEEFLTRG